MYSTVARCVTVTSSYMVHRLRTSIPHVFYLGVLDKVSMRKNAYIRTYVNLSQWPLFSQSRPLLCLTRRVQHRSSSTNQAKKDSRTSRGTANDEAQCAAVADHGLCRLLYTRPCLSTDPSTIGPIASPSVVTATIMLGFQPHHRDRGGFHEQQQ